MKKYGFEKVTLQAFLKQFPAAQKIVDNMATSTLEEKTLKPPQQEATQKSSEEVNKLALGAKSPEQHKLEVANVINEILSN